MAPFTRNQTKRSSNRHPQRLYGIEKKGLEVEHFIRVRMKKRTRGIRTFVDLPFNEDGYSYHLAELDPEVSEVEEKVNDTNLETANRWEPKPIPSYLYRIVTQQKVSLSSNDRDQKLFLGEDGNTVTGDPMVGYGMVRATHSVSHGCWYYEVEMLAQPDDSHTRIGWAQSVSPLLACVGYTKYSYGWRSKHGTAFHEGYGKHYFHNGYKQGDVLGCMISLPSYEDQINAGIRPIDVLPDTKKQCHLIKFRRNLFFEQFETHWSERSNSELSIFPRGLISKIEFFLNGESCGTAFENLYRAHYFPALSLFHSAKLRCNFGPKFRFTPECVRLGIAKPMSDRPAEMAQELAANSSYMETTHTDSHPMEHIKSSL